MCRRLASSADEQSELTVCDECRQVSSDRKRSLRTHPSGATKRQIFTTRPWTHEIEINQHVLNDVSYPTLCGLKPDISAGPKSANTESGLLDHLLGAGEQRWWDRET
jgi:hypothetical protein